MCVASPPISGHFDGRKFLNPAPTPPQGLWHLLKWVATGNRKPWPKWVENVFIPAPPTPPPEDAVAATYINHATFLLQMGGLNFLTDPIYSQRSSPVAWAGPKRVRAPGLSFEQLPRIDCVLVSHNHYDHLDLSTLARLQQAFAPLFITSWGNAALLRKAGIRHAVELDWWDSQSVLGKVDVTLTPTQHFSARTPFDRNRTLWGGFSIATAAQRICFVGDSGYGPHFKEIRERLGPIDLALVPIGAYEPRWFMQPVHINPAEAVQAHLDLAARLSVAMHFGTFQLTDEGINEPANALREALQSRGISPQQFIVPEFGQVIAQSRA